MKRKAKVMAVVAVLKVSSSRVENGEAKVRVE